jgi:hypothetical protein
MPKGNKGVDVPHGAIYDTADVTPADATALPSGPCRAIWVGVAGNIRIKTLGGTTQVLKAMAAGMWHAQAAQEIHATSTTATDIVAGY